MYNKIYEFCKVRNTGNVYKNSPTEPTPRVKYIMELLTNENIDFELDIFERGLVTCYNIILRGSSSKMIIAHHDIINPNIDNANDNSCSIINAIMVKKHLPNIHVVFTDGEEVGGFGSQRLSDQINSNEFGAIDWVLNLELTGKGGEHFFIGNYTGKLFDHIKNLFDCPVVQTPYSDTVTIRKNGIDSVVINPLPPLEVGKISIVKHGDVYLDFDLLFNCHTTRDTIDTIDIEDMKIFVEKVLLKILS